VNFINQIERISWISQELEKTATQIKSGTLSQEEYHTARERFRNYKNLKTRAIEHFNIKTGGVNRHEKNYEKK
jgi:hypothetical protein